MPMEHEPKKCTRCGKCIEECFVGATQMTEKGVVIDEELCVDCKCCVEVCEDDAMQIPEDQIPKTQEGA